MTLENVIGAADHVAGRPQSIHDFASRNSGIAANANVVQARSRSERPRKSGNFMYGGPLAPFMHTLDDWMTCHLAKGCKSSKRKT